MRTTIIAIAFFMAIFVMVTPATHAQAAPNQNRLVLSMEGNGGTILVKTHLLSECVGGYTAFGDLQRLDKGGWISQLRWSEMNLGLLTKERSTRSAYVFVDTMSTEGVYPNGVYRMHVIRRTDGGGRSCVMQGKVTHVETPHLIIGTPTEEELRFTNLPKVTSFASSTLSTGLVEFNVSSNERVRVTVFQEQGSVLVATTEDYIQGAATRVRIPVPKKFQAGLPIKAHLLGLETGFSITYPLFSGVSASYVDSTDR
ncbi:MAG: hypothetical protein RL292_514 [Candidatus Parcubacteria bacterium]